MTDETDLYLRDKGWTRIDKGEPIADSFYIDPMFGDVVPRSTAFRRQYERVRLDAIQKLK